MRLVDVPNVPQTNKHRNQMTNINCATSNESCDPHGVTPAPFGPVFHPVSTPGSAQTFLFIFRAKLCRSSALRVCATHIAQYRLPSRYNSQTNTHHQLSHTVSLSRPSSFRQSLLLLLLYPPADVFSPCCRPILLPPLLFSLLRRILWSRYTHSSPTRNPLFQPHPWVLDSHSFMIRNHHRSHRDAAIEQCTVCKSTTTNLRNHKSLIPTRQLTPTPLQIAPQLQYRAILPLPVSPIV